MTPIILNFTEEEVQRFRQRAQEIGYESVKAYFRALAEEDMSAAEDYYETLLKEYSTDGRIDAEKVRAALTPLQRAIVEGAIEGIQDTKRSKVYTMDHLRCIMTRDDD